MHFNEQTSPAAVRISATDASELESGRSLRVAFVCAEDPSDRRVWSGTPYGIFSAFKNLSYDVKWIAPRKKFYRLTQFLIKIANRALSTILRRDCVVERWAIIQKFLAKKFEINDENFDLVFNIGITRCAFLKTRLPIIAVCDAVFANFNGYYGRAAMPFFAKFANATEEKSAKRATKIVAASTWCKDGIVSHYHIPEEDVVVFQLGANIAGTPTLAPRDFSSINGELHLLFVGFDTKRKGLDIAVGATKILREQYGNNAVIDVVGTDGHEFCEKLDFVHFHGRLDKNVPAEMEKFEAIFASAHIFILPTKAECAGMVFSEAAAYGLPVFSYDTGGVSSYVENGGNGILLPLSAGSKDFAEKINDCRVAGDFPKFSKRGHELFVEKLSWSLWGARLEKLCKSIISAKRYSQE